LEGQASIQRRALPHGNREKKVSRKWYERSRGALPTLDESKCEFSAKRTNGAGKEKAVFGALTRPTREIVRDCLPKIPALRHSCRASIPRIPVPKRVQSAQLRRPIRKAQETAEQSQSLALVLLAATLEPSPPRRISIPAHTRLVRCYEQHRRVQKVTVTLIFFRCTPSQCINVDPYRSSRFRPRYSLARPRFPSPENSGPELASAAQHP